MNKDKREEILDYIYQEYTGQEVLEALSEELPNSYSKCCPTCKRRGKNGNNKRQH